MSRFFQGSSSDSSSEEDDEHEQVEDEELSRGSHLRVSASRRPVDQLSQSVEGLSVARPSAAASHQEILLHALLEERCLNEVRNDPVWSRRTTFEIEREARARYQSLTAQLASRNMISAGLDHDRHAGTRQAYRTGLDLLTGPGGLSLARPEGARRQQRLLTGPDVPAAILSEEWHSHRSIGAMSLLNPSHQLSLPGSQYLRDFDELGVLGRGGYGTVFHVKHRLDGNAYAIKKIRIKSSAVTRVNASEDQRELEEMLMELRTLARLEHPNVVRYYSSWVEWIAPGREERSSSGDGLVSSSGNVSHSHFPNGHSTSMSLHRITTATTNTAPSDDMFIMFEESGTTPADVRETSNPSVRSETRSTAASAESVDDRDFAIALPREGEVSAGIPHADATSASEPAAHDYTQPQLALHIQMALYPMTLADFLAPNTNIVSPGDVAPLAHCFHLETSIRIMLALLDGVDYIHSRGIIHRDLKPANIFIRLEKNPRSKQGCVDLLLCSQCRASNCANPATISVCIGDFGLVSKIADPTDLSSSPSTAAMAAVGTELYRPLKAPAEVNASVDIFALGIIAFELLYRFTTQMERRVTLQDLRQGRFPPHFPAEGQELISAMLALNHHDVALSVHDLQQKLSRLLDP